MQTTYTCSVCGQTYDDESELSAHMVTEHATKTDVAEEGDNK